MFKIISAETKKIVSKPGIFILSVLLAVILVLGVFIYKPTVYESKQFQLTGDTFLEKYADFNRGNNAGKKAESQTKLTAAIQSINNYVISPNLTQEEHIANLTKAVQDNYTAYVSCASNNAHQNQVDSNRLKLVNALTDLNTAVDNALINSQYGSFTLLTTTKNYNNYKKAYKDALDWSEISVEKANLRDHIEIFENKYKDNFYSSINNFNYPTLSNEFVQTYTETAAGTKLSILNERLNNINAEIDKNYQLATANAHNENVDLTDKMDELANLYVDTVDTYVNLIKYELIANAFSILSTSEQLTTMHLSQYSNFNSKSLLERYSYLFEHNKSENDFSKPLTIGISSNDEVNAYDYAYFVLKIFSFVIIVYAIMSACHSIAGEIKDGTMRYLAIRPVSRTHLLLGKWLAIILMSIILIIFSGIISICVGGAVYGFAGNPILTIFNGSLAVTMHPILMIGIFLISMLFELMVYSAIAMLVSSLFKSDLLGMTLMLMLYLVNILLPMFVPGSNTWLAFYPFSHLSLYALFGSSVYAVSGNFFNLIFGAKVYAGTHAILTTSLILILIIAVIALSIKVFKRKEL